MPSVKSATRNPTTMLVVGLFTGVFIMTILRAIFFDAPQPYEVANIKYVPVPVSDKHVKMEPVLQLSPNPPGIFKSDTMIGAKGYAVAGPPGPTETRPRVIGLPKPDDYKVFGELERKAWLNKAAEDVLEVVKEHAVRAARQEAKNAVLAEMSALKGAGAAAAAAMQQQQQQQQQQQDSERKSLAPVMAAGPLGDPDVVKYNNASAPALGSGGGENATNATADSGGGLHNVVVDFALPEQELKIEEKQEKMATVDFPVDVHPEEPLFNDPTLIKYSYRQGGLLPRDGQKKPTVHGIPWDKRLVPKAWEAQSISLAQAALEGNWIEEEGQWNEFFKHNARGMLSWEHYSKQRSEAARLQKLKKEIVSLKEVILGVKGALEMAGRLRQEGKEDEILPVYGYAFTRYDFAIMLHGLARYIDTGVDSFVFVQNGANPVAEIYLRSLQHIFGAEKIAVYRRNVNMGVSNSWNTMATHGFDMMTKEQAFVLISNADCIAAPGRLAMFAKATWLGLVQGETDRDRMIINRLGEFALFIITHVGWRKLGLFDENLFPAYGEDVEIHIRAVSLGLGGDLHFRNTGAQKESKDFYHLHATNSKKGIGYSRPAMMQYMSKKWGVNMAGVRDFQFARPYKHPFNNCRIYHNDSWIVDWGYRDCLRSRTGCTYPLQAAQRLIHHTTSGTNRSALKGVDCVEGFVQKR